MNFSDDELDDIAVDQAKRKKPPMFDAGMDDTAEDINFGSSEPFKFGDSTFGKDDTGFGGSSSFGTNTSFGGSGFGDSGFGGGGFGGSFETGSPVGFGGSGFGDTSTPTNQKSTEDKIFDGAKVASKETFNFVKLAITAYKSQSRVQWVAMYRYSLYSSVGLTTVGILLAIFGVRSLDIITGSLVVLGMSTVGFMYNLDKAEKEEEAGIDIGRNKPIGGTPLQQNPTDTGFGTADSGNGFGGDNTFGQPSGGFGEFSSGFGTNGFGNTDVGFGSGFGSTDSFGSDNAFGDKPKEEGGSPFDSGSSDFDFSTPSKTSTFLDSEEFKEKENKTREEIIEDSLNEVVETKAITRSYLFEKFSEILEPINPDYSKVTKIDEDDKDFRKWALVVKKSAELFAPKNVEDDDMPYLISLEERLFYYYLVVQRVKWLKDTDKFIDEIVKYYAFDDKKGEMDTNVYGKGTASGDKIYIKIMRSVELKVSLKDVYESNLKKVKNSKMKMPVVIGVTEEGDIILEDFFKVNSILVAGEPRSGKSYLTKSMLIQMMAFNSPEEVEFYIFDTKGGTSDFKKMDIPHVKDFESDMEMIVRKIQKIIDIEGAKRSRLQEQAGVINIIDYNKKNPDKQMSYLYIVIDEVVSMVDSMPQDLKKEFQTALSVLITRFPNLGIRLFMIPHAIRDDVIKKRTTTNIPCRISVRGSESHIESTTGATYKDFPYKLKNVGDLAVKLTNDVPVYSKGVIIAEEENGYQEVIDFLRKMWLKLMPESIEGSYYQKRLRETTSTSRVVEGDTNVKARTVEIIPPSENKKSNNALSNEEQDKILDDFWNNL